MPTKSGHRSAFPTPHTRGEGREATRHRRRERRLGVVFGLAVLTALASPLVAEVVTADAATGAHFTGNAAVPNAAPDQAAVDAADQARVAFPAHTIPAREVLALSVPARGVQAAHSAAAARTPATAPAGAMLTPAAKARLAVEARASRATARAVAGARPGFSRPVEGTRLTSGFGPRWGRMHAGIDFAGPIGQVIRAVGGGTVTVAGPASGYGRLIEIRHDDGRFTRYGHLHRVDVKTGDRVEAAQPIGALGNAGRSTGPHLHFEVRTPAGTAVDPAPWLAERGITPVEAPPER